MFSMPCACGGTALIWSLGLSLWNHFLPEWASTSLLLHRSLSWTKAWSSPSAEWSSRWAAPSASAPWTAAAGSPPEMKQRDSIGCQKLRRFCYKDKLVLGNISNECSVRKNRVTSEEPLVWLWIEPERLWLSKQAGRVRTQKVLMDYLSLLLGIRWQTIQRSQEW